MTVRELIARNPVSSALRWLRRTLNSELNQLSYNRQNIEVGGFPEVFQVELTNHCPMTCVMCPRTNNMTRELGYMSADLFQRVVREIKTHSSRIFLHHFGDSLVHPELPAFIKYANQHHIKTFLSTNAALLTEERARALVDSGLHELVISLDGVTAETNAAIRGPAARNVENAESRIRFLLDYRRQQGSQKPFIILQFVQQKLNQHECAEWLEKWSAVEGIDRIKVKSFVTWDGQDENINALRVGSDRPQTDVVCDKPWTSVTVLWDGRVVPCCFDHDGLYVLGDLREQSLPSIWRGEQAQALRKAHRERNVRGIRLCQRCTDKEGYDVRKWYYPLNRWFSRQDSLAAEDTKAVNDEPRLVELSIGGAESDSKTAAD